MRRIVVSFCSAVLPLLPASAAIVINEIHYNPDVKTEPAEFVELYNSGTNPVSLAGWYFSSGISYTFSNNISIAVGGYAVIAQNPAFLATKYPGTASVGPFVGGLSKYGEKVTLKNASDVTQDEVEYQLGFPWPTVGDPPGFSIELINPDFDNDLGGSWRSHAPTPGRRNVVFATNAPPQIRQVEHNPEQPTGGQSVKISAKVTDPNGVAGVTLQYQIVVPGGYIELTNAAYTNAANWISLPMNDSGSDGDLAAGDDTFTATIPGSVQAHRRLIRYRITVADTLGSSVRVPYADDPQPNFAYFVYNGVPGWSGAVQPGVAGSNGVVVNFSSNVMGRLPVYHLIGTSNAVATATWFSRYTADVIYPWAGTLVYDGKVYDHIHYRARGGVWRYSMVKNMWKFDMNRGHDFEARDNWGRKYKTGWTKLNLGASIQQGDFNHRGEQGMFESVGFRLFQLAGVEAPNTVFVTFRVIDDALEQAPNTQFEGDFWGVYLSIEQEDSRFLEEHGLPDGNLYKMEGGTGELNNQGPNDPTNKSDLNAFLNAYNSPTNASLPDIWWRTNLNLTKYYGYQLVVQGIHHYDIADGKNYFYYHNPETKIWEVCTWDLDLTWADNMYRGGQQGGDEPFKLRVLNNFAIPGARPVFGTEFRNRVREWRDLMWNTDQVFKLIDEYAALLRGPTNLPTILDADRMMWDYNPKMLSSVYSENPASKAGQGRFYQWPNQTPNPVGLPKTFEGGLQLMKTYVGYRSTNATFSFDTISLDNAKPNRPTITYTGPSSYSINSLTFRSSAYSGANAFASMRWRVGEITDTNAPNYRADEPRKYEVETVWDSGPITTFNADITIPAEALRIGSRYRVRVKHTDVTGRDSQWSLAHEFTCGEPVNQTDLLNYLRITEVMFNPPAGGYEYVELYNSSSTITLDLSGVKFTQGIDYAFAQGTTLLPGAYIVLVGTLDIAGFRAYYGLDGSVTVLGPYTGALNNGGEQLVLRTSAGGTDIVNFNYGDGRGWPPQADGTGHSLVLLDSALAAQGGGAGEFAGNWRASTYLRGSPGRADDVAPTGIVLNEIVAYTDPTGEFDSNDWIELYNATDSPVTLGPGWYLSDDGGSYTNLTKWAIPASTLIPAHGFVSFDEITGFHNPTNIGFGLSKGGDEVFLSYLPGNAQDRVVDAVSFKGQENNWSLGRYPDGGPFWYALTPRTRDAANAAPPQRVIISEILYHPPDELVGTNATDNSIDEFIEIASGYAQPATIIMTNQFGPWRFNGGVEFSFPADMLLFGPERILVVNFDPGTNAAQVAAFRSKYSIAPTVRLFGPYSGKLANNSDRIALEKPQGPDLPGGDVSWVVVDEVLYADQSPWPCGSDGTGNSLQRLNALQHGSDPLNWSAEPPTAGRPRENLPAGLPAITAQPQDRVAPTNGNVSFSVSVCGTPPFTYQWRFNGSDIANATNATLNLLNVTPASAGLYSVVVSNPAGSTPSAAASLIVQFPPVITVHPQPATAIRDQSATFSVTVGGGTPPFGYQWQFGGVNISGATNSVLVLTNVQASQAGNYAVRVFNTAGSVISSSVALTVLIPSTITQAPTNRTVTVTYNTNGYYNPTGATFTVGAVGTGTLRYQWRFNGVDIPGATSSTLLVTNITPANEGPYSAVVNDDIGPAISPAATLTVLTPPVFVSLPPSQSVVQGGNVMLSVAIEAHPPPFTYEWRRGSIGLATNVSSQKTAFFNLTNVQFVLTNGINNVTGSYRIIVKNLANSSPGVLGNPVTTVLGLPDADGDGIPDAWESSYGGSATSLEPDADLDGDGMKNREEYVAGTDPTDPLSYLRVENIQSTSASDVRVRIGFNAVSNRTYTVLFSEQPGGPAWSRVADVIAASTNRALQIFDQRPSNAPPRFYRLVTPKNP